MSKTAGSVRGGGRDGSGRFKGEIRNIGSLADMKDARMYRETKSAISRYETVMGVRQRNVKLADFDGAYGVHRTNASGQSEGVYLNRAHFNQGAKAVAAAHRRGYDSKWSTRTNKPVAHTITHELAHATWNSHLTKPNAIAAGKEVDRLFNTWRSDRRKSGYGRYANTNVNEFWAETVTRAVHGTPDKYTRAVKDIAKRYKL